jgi:tartrate dehydratase beta subunit/fumarate hydratase class I family protein
LFERDRTEQIVEILFNQSGSLLIVSKGRRNSEMKSLVRCIKSVFLMALVFLSLFLARLGAPHGASGQSACPYQ